MSGIRQHKTMAVGRSVSGQRDNFGVEPLREPNIGFVHPDGDDMRAAKTLDDHERSAPPPISRGAGKMHATAHSDHGPHHHLHGGGKGAYGVARLPR